jgi:hypothetical protein
MNRLAFISVDVDDLLEVFRDAEPHESGAFFLLREARGLRGSRLLAVDPIFPSSVAWEKQGEAQLRPSARWISAAISRAVTEHAGLLFVHSHPDPRHPIGFSPTDRNSIHSLAETIGPILEGPFAAAVVHAQGWAAVVVDDGRLVPIERVVSVGRALRLLTPLEPPPPDDATDIPGLDDRQRDALGRVHDVLHQLDVAVVGVGGIGSAVAEQLARMGTGSVTLVDSDVLDTPSNVRRVIGSSLSDLHATTPPRKVDVVGGHLDRVGLGVLHRRVFGDVRDELVWKGLLDVDVILGCTDTHGSRAAINDLSSAYLLPVIDVGTQAAARNGVNLAALVAEISVLTPVTPCLWCRDRISAEVIRAENLPANQRDKLAREGYLIGGVGEPAPSVMALTALGAGLATCALLAMLSSEGDVSLSGYWVDGFMGDSGETQPIEPVATCRCRRRLGRGDAH